MPQLRSLEIFYWVARLGSFRGASERLHTTQPAVSQRVASLEAELGVQLFDREARAVTLTAKGRELFDYAERMLNLRGDMLRAIAAPSAMSGVLRLGVSETIVHTWLSAFIERAHAAHPAITIDIEVDVSPSLRSRLIDHEIDLAFMLGPVSDPRMNNYDLCRYPLAFIASPKLDLPDGPISLSALLRFPLITYPKTARPYIMLREMLRAPDHPTPRIFGNASLSSIVRMTLDRIGISVIPPLVVRRELEEGTLRVINTEVEMPDLTFMAVLPVSPEGSLAQPLAQLACEVAREAENVGN
ncbi:HTH-type transcriptional regulator YofA [Variibacter gotjawalensis]|uniref:HTH-type transcriptional regulator YofA n=1 Tax=Variibacter gotjawalensis TaxID=1333996 RepID=A0A0S3PVP6_9BRAD|nr:LysR family transcriptional regulator [Variibacter gotjawalensis]NIK45741.1 DNA-binding transcriptional LysR family regulator [Variibacter gotjawalensis]RZS47665.1 DNA-binding transcriptional LysR family regulator [Variibacter gotjawalensis]BAT59918.1 HTH-type transcriptional regulator YofA [Variibacter gotjawalensis]